MKNKTKFNYKLGNGGKLKSPIIVNDKNDPRLKAYNDSLGLFNGTPTTTSKDKKLQIIKRTKQDYYSKENFNKKETGFNSDNGEIIPFSVNQPIGFVGFDDNSGVYPTYKKPVQPIIYKEPNHKLNSYDDYLNAIKKAGANIRGSKGMSDAYDIANEMLSRFPNQELYLESGYNIPKRPTENKRKEINQLTPITNVQMPLDNTQLQLKTVTNDQPIKNGIVDMRVYTNKKGGYVNEGKMQGRQEFKLGGWLDTFGDGGIISTNDTIYDPATLAKYSKNGLTPKYVVKTTNKVPYNVKKTTLAKPIEEESLLSKALDKVDDVMSAPQKAMTYGIEAGLHATGLRKAEPKYESPSDGLDIKNKWGKMAVDLVADPMNLLGVSAISKGVSRIGGKVLNKIAGTTAEHLDEFAKLADKAPLDLHNTKTKKVFDNDKWKAATEEYDKYARNNLTKDANWFKNSKEYNKYWKEAEELYKTTKYADYIKLVEKNPKMLEFSKTGAGTALINDLINQSNSSNKDKISNTTKYAISESYKPVFDTPKSKVKFNKILTTLPVKQEVTKQVEQPKIEASQEYTKTPTKQSIDYTFNGEYIPSDTPNVPNVKTLKDRKTNKPMFFINQAGDKIPYDRTLKGITKEFQYKKKLGGWLDKLN